MEGTGAHPTPPSTPLALVNVLGHYIAVVKFEVVSRIEEIKVIASGSGIRNLRYLRKAYGRGRWRKLKEVASIRLPNGIRRKVE